MLISLLSLCGALLVQDRDDLCRRNLETLGKLAEQYREKFGGPEKSFPKAAGSDFWLALTRTTPPLLTPEALGKLRCPYSNAPVPPGMTNYRGAIPMGVDPVAYVGACEPGHHPDGVVRSIERGRAASEILKPGERSYLNAMERTRGLPGSPASNYFDAVKATRMQPDVDKNVERWSRAAEILKQHPGLKLEVPEVVAQQLAQAVERRKIRDEVEKEYAALKAAAETATPEEEKGLRDRLVLAVGKAMTANLPRLPDLKALQKILSDRDTARNLAAQKHPPPDPAAARPLQLKHAENMAKILRSAIEQKDESMRARALRSLATFEAGVASEAVQTQIDAAKEPAVKEALRAALQEIRAKPK